MSDDSLFRVGTILLLVGAILSAIGAVLMFLFAFGLSAVINAIDGQAEDTAVVLAIYGGLAIVLAIGSVFGFLGFRAGQQGDAQKAFVFGLICALVPPVQLVPLLGAIFCKITPPQQQSP